MQGTVCPVQCMDISGCRKWACVQLTGCRLWIYRSDITAFCRKRKVRVLPFILLWGFSDTWNTKCRPTIQILLMWKILLNVFFTLRPECCQIYVHSWSFFFEANPRQMHLGENVLWKNSERVGEWVVRSEKWINKLKTVSEMHINLWRKAFLKWENVKQNTT